MFATWLIVSDTTFGGSGVGLNVYLGILVLLATGALVGIVNGFLVVGLQLGAFIVTLAMLILLRGVTLGITNGKTMFDLPSEFPLGSAKWLGVPVSIWVAGALYVLVGLFLRYHRTGRAIYAIGSRRPRRRHQRRADHLEPLHHGRVARGARRADVTGGSPRWSRPGPEHDLLRLRRGGDRRDQPERRPRRLARALTGVTIGILHNVLTLSQIAAFWIDAAYGLIILVSLILARLTGGTARET